MFRLIGLFIVCTIFSGCSPSEKEIREKIVKIVGDKGLCSGEQVKGHSGKSYIITAAHCKDISSTDVYTVFRESGEKLKLRAIEEYEDNDLLLLEGLPGVEGLEVASNSFRNEKIWTYTHGGGLDTYITEGRQLQVQNVQIFMGPVTDEKSCQSSKYNIQDINSFFGSIRACMMKLRLMGTTAKVVPGSSGGAIVNYKGELVGVVSATDGNFGYSVPIDSIQAFLAGY